MRLTLRTLLAYMDDILEPADHEDLGKKIEASDFATELIHRSRDTVRRLRLGAPAVITAGSDDVLDSTDLGDANSVAEYLDNTLPPEQVAEFERMCLEQGTEADMHLAEVASCHHVLTMVLGEPAEVDAEVKARMYDLPAKLASGQKLRIEPAHVAPQTAPPQESTAPAAPPMPQPASVTQNEIPDYLREAAAAKRRSRRWAIAMTILAIGAIIGWFATAPEPELPSDIAGGDIEAFDDGEIDIEGLDDITSENMTDLGGADSTAPPFIPAESATPGEPAADPDTAPPFVPAPAADESEEIMQPEQAEVATVQPLIDIQPPEFEEEMPGEQEEMTGDPESDSQGTLAATIPSPDPDFPLPDDPDTTLSPDVPQDDKATTSEPEMPLTTDLLTNPEPQVDAEPEVTEPVGPQRLGNYLGNSDVLLIYNPTREKWVRMPPRSPISTGDELLTLPSFRTHVVLADVNAYLSGGTRLRIPLEGFDTSSSETELQLDMVYGRVLLNAGLKGSQVAVRVDDQLREFQLASSASLAVDVQRIFVPGSDYENQAAPTMATWYLTTGSVQWPTATGGTQTVEAPARWKTIDGIDEIPELIQELPEWIDREPVTDVERMARENLANELAASQPVGIRLLELTEGEGLGRKKEVRILAAKSGVYVGEFQPLVKALNDSEHSRAWDTLVQGLRQAMALSPDVATSIRQDFASIRGEEAADDLMEMVTGYSPLLIGKTREEIQSGALLQLIEWLDHESLDYRVLAIHNIEEITNKTKPKGYRPDDSAKRRKIALRKIWEDFESNELLPQS